MHHHVQQLRHIRLKGMGLRRSCSVGGHNGHSLANIVGVEMAALTAVCKITGLWLCKRLS